MVGKIWYVLPCIPDKEDLAAELLKQYFRCKGQEKIFNFTYEQMKRYEGAWHQERKPLFKGYFFVETENEEKLARAIKECGKTEGHQSFSDVPWEGIYPLGKEETEYLKKLGGKEHHVSMSRGYIRSGVTFVTEGPLRGKEPDICKIDRHKRLARLKTPLDRYQKKGIWTGLEIVSKS